LKTFFEKIQNSALTFALSVLSLAPVAASAQNVPNVTYQGPITITSGGTYTGNYRSNDSSVPAIVVATSAPVTIQNSIIVSAGDLIQANTGTSAHITVLNSQGYGTTPTQGGRTHGRFIAATNALNIRAENNYLEHTAGFTIYQFSGNGSASQTVTILRNKVKDIDGRDINGDWNIANFVGLNTVRNVANIEIAWNEVINEPNLSSVEDNINFYNSGGTAQSIARVHDNYIQGAYPIPANGSTFSGTGMTTDGTYTTQGPQYLDSYNNQFISTCNAAMNIASGHDIHYYNNRMITSGLLPDGSRLNATWAGTAVFDGNGSGSSIFYNNSIDNNTIGFVSWGGSSPYQDRRDLSPGACATCSGNTHLPNTITLQMEAAEFTSWQQKLSQNGITIGNGGGTTTPPASNTAPTVSLTAPTATTGTVGTALSLTATAADANGTVSKVEFFNGSTKLGEDLTSPYALSYTPTAAGTLTLTARATDNAGATTTSAARTVTVSGGTTTTPPTGGTTTGGPANSIFFRAINLGGAALTIDGLAYEAGASAANFQSNATGWANQSATLNPATDAARAEMLRDAYFGTGPTFALSGVASGTYSVYLYIWEDDAAATTDILLEGATVRSGYNTGSAGHWEKVGPFAASVTDGTIDVATSGGNVNISGIEVWKQNATTTNTAPTVSLTAPTATTGTVGTALSLTATAADANGTVSKVEFFNGSTKLGEDLTSPYALSYTPTAAGTLTLTARATDNAGATTTSAARTVTVSGGTTPTNTAPTVSLTAPTATTGTVGTALSLTATAADANGTVSKVEFFNGSTKLGEDLTSPYALSYTPTAAGTLTLTARATDNAGATTTSAARTVTVAAAPTTTNTPPTITFSAPTTATVGQAVTLTATATDANGAVTNVEFYNNNSKIGQDLTAPYSLSYTFTKAGIFSLMARATDNKGATTNSALITITVTTGTATTPPPTTGVPASSTFFRAINLGGRALTIDGHNFEAGSSAANFQSNATGWANQSATLNPATDAARAEMLRDAYFGTGPTFALSGVASGTYSVYLYIWEDDAAATTNILLEGATVRSGYNTGSAGHWEKVGPFAASVTDGTINVATSGGNVNISGIEVWKQNTTAARSTTTGATASFTASPNPFGASLNIQVPVTQAEQMDLGLYNSAGVLVRRQSFTFAPNATTQTIATADLVAGNYTLRFLSGSLSGRSLNVQKQ
jgi:chitinase